MRMSSLHVCARARLLSASHSCQIHPMPLFLSFSLILSFTYLSSGNHRSRSQCSPPPSTPTTSTRRQMPRESIWPSCNTRARTGAPNGTPCWDCRWTTRLPLKQPQPDPFLAGASASASPRSSSGRYIVILVFSGRDRIDRRSLFQKSVSQRIRNHSARQSRLAATGSTRTFEIALLSNQSDSWR